MGGKGDDGGGGQQDQSGANTALITAQQQAAAQKQAQKEAAEEPVKKEEKKVEEPVVEEHGARRPKRSCLARRTSPGSAMHWWAGCNRSTTRPRASPRTRRPTAARLIPTPARSSDRAVQSPSERECVMGGKGGEASNVMQQQYESAPSPGTGGYIYPETGTTEPPKREPVKKEEKKRGADHRRPEQGRRGGDCRHGTQPYGPPGLGNYPAGNTNLTGLGDMLVQGMQAQPGKAGPTRRSTQDRFRRLTWVARARSRRTTRWSSSRWSRPRRLSGKRQSARLGSRRA